MNKKKEIEIDVLHGPLDLWDRFSKTADFKSNEYDKTLLAEIKEELGFDKNCDVCIELAAQNTTSEQLLAVLLKTMRPFSIMLSDLLNMFEAAAAQFSDKNIQIKFDFENAEDSFDLNLNRFRVHKEMVGKAVYYELRLDDSNPWKQFIGPLEEITGIDNPLGGYNLAPPYTEDVKKWLKAYEDKNYQSNWPDWFPKSPQSGVERIDELIADIWEIPRAAVESYRKCYKEELGRSASLMSQEGKTHSIFFQAETDHWVQRFIADICYLAKMVKANQNEIDIQKLGAFHDQLPLLKNELKRYLDILNLPVWEKRYALYSAWVSTQIVDAFDKNDVNFHVVKGVLSFSFGGSLIANIRHESLDLKLVAELRTPYANVRGHGRKSSIQPDYSLCINDESDPKNTVLVVECKQYKKASKKNFIDAIIDYTGGRPIAQVMLVNYTPIPNSIKSSLSPKVSDRVPFFDTLIPGDESCETFKKAVLESLPKESLVSLSWKEKPLDLDLMLIITAPDGKKTEVNYSNMGRLDQFPYAILNKDDRNGNGLEKIRALSYRSLKYDFYVQNYSGEKAEGPIRVEVALDHSGFWIENTSDLTTTSLWHVLSISHTSICIVNNIVLNHHTHVQTESEN